MPRAFLSHSSAQKKSYVEIVASKLGPNKCVYDDLTFEAGMKNIEEIMRGLARSDVFVVFLSETALNSNWVKEELFRAHELLESGSIKRIYPIIIDKSITHKDPRIPDWMREEYNLRYVGRPTVAARMIMSRLIETTWEMHPRIKEREQLFVGRNNLIENFEERVYRYDIPYPNCIIASGIKSIGRRSLIRHCLIKTGVIRPSYSFLTIELSARESIEDFIYKVFDLGMSETFDRENLISKTLEEKVNIADMLTKDLIRSKDILLIEDNGCIITEEGGLSAWFDNLLGRHQNDNSIVFVVVAKFRVRRNWLVSKDYVFGFSVPELEKVERAGLLSKYLQFEDINIGRDDFDFIINLLNGFPEQVSFAVGLIKAEGMPYLRLHSHLLPDFNSEKVNKIMQKYEGDSDAFEFLHLLCEFDFIGYELITDIVGEDSRYMQYIP
jgi:hypothetical protein